MASRSLLPVAACLVLAVTLNSGSAHAQASGETRVKAATDASVVRGETYSRIMRAIMAARKGENRAAAAEIRKAVQLLPNSSQVRLQGADILYRMGRRSEAIQLAEEALALAPQNPDVLTFLGDRAAETAFVSREGDARASAEAVAYYDQLVELGVESDEMLGKLATLRLETGDRPGAIDAARRLVTRRPGDRRAAGSLAQLLLEEQRDAEALDVVLVYLTRHPEQGMMLRLADELARRLDAWERIDETFSVVPALRDRPNAVQGLWGEGLLYLGRIPEATGLLESAVEADHSNVGARFNLGRAYHVLGRYADAAALFSELAGEVEGVPSAQARRLLGETQNDQGDARSARVSFIEALELLQGDVDERLSGMRDELRKRVVAIDLAAGALEAARERLDEIEEPDEAEVMELRARLALIDEDSADVRSAVRRLQALDRDGAAALIEGELLARAGKWGKAADRFDAAVTALGGWVRVRIADLYVELGRTDEGLAVYERWIEVEPRSAEAHYYLGAFLFRLERTEEAERAMRTVLEIDAEHAPALNFLGYSYAERSTRLDEALDLVQRALLQDAWSGAYLDSLGWVYFQLGRYSDAREPLERAAREHPRDSTVLEHLGDVYDRLGEAELALAAWLRALESEPEESDGLRKKIARRQRDSGVADQALVEEPAAEQRSDDDESAPPMRP